MFTHLEDQTPKSFLFQSTVRIPDLFTMRRVRVSIFNTFILVASILFFTRTERAGHERYGVRDMSSSGFVERTKSPGGPKNNSEAAGIMPGAPDLPYLETWDTAGLSIPYSLFPIP